MHLTKRTEDGSLSNMGRRSSRSSWPFVWLAFWVLIAGCRLDMHIQPRYKPLDASNFFDDRRSSRPAVPGTVARGHLRDDDHLYMGKVRGVLVNTFPFPITRGDLERGRERFNIYCSPCHARIGDGRGMIVKRGFPQPPSYHIDRLRQAPIGHFFDVMTNGYGAMHSYAAQVSPEDRWRVAAYIRALQLSQHVSVNDLPEQDRKMFVGRVP